MAAGGRNRLLEADLGLLLLLSSAHSAALLYSYRAAAGCCLFFFFTLRVSIAKTGLLLFLFIIYFCFFLFFVHFFSFSFTFLNWVSLYVSKTQFFSLSFPRTSLIRLHLGCPFRVEGIFCKRNEMNLLIAPIEKENGALLYSHLLFSFVCLWFSLSIYLWVVCFMPAKSQCIIVLVN